MIKMNQTRKNQIKNKVLLLLAGLHISFLPIDLDQIMDSLLVKTLSFSAACSRGIIIPEGIEGFTVIRQRTSAPSQYLLVYRDDISFERLRWTLAHEIGHIVLGHLLRPRDSQREAVFEEEANYFAKELLMPLPVLAMIGARSVADISRVCGVSYEAAQIRARDFERYDWYRLKHGDTAEDLRFLACFEQMRPAE